MHVHDHERHDRIGMPEAVLCSSKTAAQIELIVADLAASTDRPVLFTRLSAQLLAELDAGTRAHLDYHPESATATMHGRFDPRPGPRVAVVTAGTSDAPVALEAAQTLRFLGVGADVIVDVGVAGLWRLERRLPEIREAAIVIAVAGMDAALVSVLGGLVGAPIIAVPTSVGYGVAEGGGAALNSALASCAQGVTVVNIDNGFGAACAAVRILGAAPTDT
jgi:NCAIR mutase (PurE)-related protein